MDYVYDSSNTWPRNCNGFVLFTGDILYCPAKDDSTYFHLMIHCVRSPWKAVSVSCVELKQSLLSH